MPAKYYQDNLYPFQDRVLGIVGSLDVNFYLTGGTALSRCYLNHRYSDDLDLFLNADSRFQEQCKSVMRGLTDRGIEFETGVVSNSFARLVLSDRKCRLKVDLVDDVAYRWGSVENNAIFSRVDNWRNILSNKICALSRMEAKDIVDILFIAVAFEFDWEEIFAEASRKDAWANPLHAARIIETFSVERLQGIKWIKPVKSGEIANRLRCLHNDIFAGNANSLTNAIK